MRTYTSLAVALAVSLFSSHVAAQNLIPNADIDTGIAGWNANNGAVLDFDQTQNVVGAVSGGSISVLNTTGNGSGVDANVCLVGPFPEGNYSFGAWIRIPQGQGGSVSGHVLVSFRSDAACSTPIQGAATVVGPDGANDSWNLYTDEAVAPAGAGSARVALQVFATNPGTTVFFDGVRFGPAPTLPVELQTFSVD